MTPGSRFNLLEVNSEVLPILAIVSRGAISFWLLAPIGAPIQRSVREVAPTVPYPAHARRRE
jgi:hypothetical protein